MGVNEETLRNLQQASPGTEGLCVADHERDFAEALDSTALSCGDKNTSAGVQVPPETPPPPLSDDPESPRDIVHENVLVLFPVALFFLFLLLGLVIAFSE